MNHGNLAVVCYSVLLWAVLGCPGLYLAVVGCSGLIGWGGHWSGGSGDPGDPGDPGGPGGPGCQDDQLR